MQILYKNKTAEKQFSSKYKKSWKYPEQVKRKLEAAENFIRSSSSLEIIDGDIMAKCRMIKIVCITEVSTIMSNTTEYNDIVAFHPGYYVADIIEDMGISQAEFATRMGTTAKTLSNLVNGQINLSNDLAKKIAVMLGTSLEVWLNLQSAYDQKLIEIEMAKDFDAQKAIVGMIDYSYFVKVANLPATRDVREKAGNLCKYFMISNLQILAQPDFLVNFRTGISNVEEKNMINARAWIQTAMNFGKSSQTNRFHCPT